MTNEAEWAGRFYAQLKARRSNLFNDAVLEKTDKELMEEYEATHPWMKTASDDLLEPKEVRT